METKDELEALNNALNYYNLNGYKIHKYWADDKRKTKQMYFLTDDKGGSLTGHWYYTEINYFIMGYGKAFNRFNKATTMANGGKIKKRKRFNSNI